MRLSQDIGNPAFRALASSDAWGMTRAGVREVVTTMTVQGTALKTLALTAILLITAGWSWTATGQGDLPRGIVLVAGIVGLVIALITCFKPSAAPYTAPVYAAAQGVFLGVISHLFQVRYQGIVVNAASLTMMTLFVMLVIYSNRWITVTDRLRTGILAATGAICLVYLVALLMRLFGYPMPFIHDAGPIGIGFSLLVVGLAAFNLLLDFDFIERGASSGQPKWMEWYGAFGLMVTLIWLYLEILRLLAKLQSRR